MNEQNPVQLQNGFAEAKKLPTTPVSRPRGRPRKNPSSAPTPEQAIAQLAPEQTPAPEREPQLKVRDREGVMSAAALRIHFEMVINRTRELAAYDLAAVVQDGKFAYYANEKTDRLWLGFALGMRAYERLNASLKAQG